MADKKLPAYYEKYFDEKFHHTNDKINGVDEKVNGVKKELKKLNGSVSELKNQDGKSEVLRATYIPDFIKTKKKVNILLISVIVLTILFILFVEESRVILNTVFSGLF